MDSSMDYFRGTTWQLLEPEVPYQGQVGLTVGHVHNYPRPMSTLGSKLGLDSEIHSISRCVVENPLTGFGE